MTEVGDSPDYDAFISYAHAADGALAPQLQTGLQRFAKPWWRRRALRVFRDESGLSASPHLWGAIEDALDRSGWLVLLLSPDAARSEWVGREIEHWLVAHSADRILPVLTAGELVWDPGASDFDRVASDAVPPVLLGVFRDEPRWVDLRWAATTDQVDLRNPRFRAAVADLAAPMHGVAKDELESEEIRQHRRARRTAWAAVCALAILVLVSVTGAALAVQAQRRAADAEEAASAQALSSDASRLGAEARSGTTYDLSLLLAVEAVRLDPSPRSRSDLFATLLRGDAVRSVRRTGGTIASLLVSPDGSTVTTVTDDGDLRTWPLVQGSSTSDVRVDGVTSPSGFPRALARLPDGRLLVDAQPAADATSTRPTVVDRTSGSKGVTAAEGTNDFALSPDGSHVIAVRVDDHGAFTDTVVASSIATTASRRTEVRLGAPIVWVTRCGDLACALTADRQMVRLRFNDAVEVGRVAMPPQTIVAPELLTVNQWFAASPDGHLVAAPCSDNVVRLVDPATGSVVRVLGGTTKDGAALAFSPDGRQLAGRDGSTVLVWQLDGAALPERLDGHGGRVSVAAFTPDGASLVTTAEDQAMIVWDLSGKARVGQVLTRSLGSSTSSLWAAGTEIAVGQNDGNLVFVDPTSGRVAQALGGRASLDGAGLSTVRSGVGSDRLVATSFSGRTTIWSLREHRLLTVVSGLPSLDPAYLPDTWVAGDGRLAATIRDGTGIRILDVSSGTVVRSLTPLPTTSRTVYFTTVVGWTADGTGVLAFRQTDDPAGLAELFVVDASSGAVRMSTHLPWTPNEAVEDPTGRVLAVGGDGGRLVFLDPATGKEVAPSVTANDSSVYNLSASADGRWYSASGGPPQVTLWDAHAFSLVGGPLPVDADARDARSRFTPDGRLVVATGGTLRAFTVDPAAWVARACAEAGRSLTIDEWNQYLPERAFDGACG